MAVFPSTVVLQLCRSNGVVAKELVWNLCCPKKFELRIFKAFIVSYQYEIRQSQLTALFRHFLRVLILPKVEFSFIVIESLSDQMNGNTLSGTNCLYSVKY